MVVAGWWLGSSKLVSCMEMAFWHARDVFRPHLRGSTVARGSEVIYERRKPQLELLPPCSSAQRAVHRTAVGQFQMGMTRERSFPLSAFL